MSDPSPDSPATDVASAGWWSRRVRDPLIALLKRGTTPEALAKTLAWSGVCSLFPFLGFTTGLNLLVGQWLKLNHALMQSINYLLSPVHLLMILVYVRLGETVWRSGESKFTVSGMLDSLKELSIGQFLHTFGWVGVHAFTAWALTAPVLYWLILSLSRPALAKLKRARNLKS